MKEHVEDLKLQLGPILSPDILVRDILAQIFYQGNILVCAPFSSVDVPAHDHCATMSCNVPLPKFPQYLVSILIKYLIYFLGHLILLENKFYPDVPSVPMQMMAQVLMLQHSTGAFPFCGQFIII